MADGTRTDSTQNAFLPRQTLRPGKGLFVADRFYTAEQRGVEILGDFRIRRVVELLGHPALEKEPAVLLRGKATQPAQTPHTCNRPLRV